MSTLVRKFKLIFVPYLVIATSTICICTFLNWLLIVKFQAFLINEDVIEFFIPAGLVFISLLIWLRPLLKRHLILVSKGSRDPLLFLIMVVWIVIETPMIIAQNYIVTATGKLTRLDNIGRINSLPATKYYTAKDFYINKNLVHLYRIITVSGKHNTKFNMLVYAAVPVFDHLFPDTNKIAQMRNTVNPNTLIIINGKLSTMPQLKKLPADSISKMHYLNPTFVMPQYGGKGKYGAIAVITRGVKKKMTLPVIKISPAAWLALKYKNTIDNSLSPAEKNKQLSQFSTQCYKDFTHAKLNNFTYLNRVAYNDEDLKYYVDAVNSVKDVDDTYEPTFLLPVFDSFANRNGNDLAWILGSFGVGSTVFFLFLQIPKLRNITEKSSTYL